jgi:hypothetical protein
VTPSPAPSRGSGPAGCIIAGCLVLSLAMIAAFGWFVYAAVKSHGFGLFSCVREPYYPALVARITKNEAFARELGAPIRVDDPNVFCNSINDSGDSRKATCDLPVSGPHGTGYVHAVIDDEDGDLTTTLRLHVGERIIRAGP